MSSCGVFTRNWRGLAVASTILSLSAPQASEATTIVQLAAGFSHICALDSDGDVWCWGSNVNGQLGDGTLTNRPTPQKVDGLQNIAAIYSSSSHVCAVRANAGGVSCWGSNSEGQVGNGETGFAQTRPARVPGLNRVADMGLGGFHSCARRNNGRLLCWGSNFNGRLGDGTATPRLTPTVVSGFNRNADQVVAGNAHTCALRRNGRVFCWGTGASGRLGTGDTAPRFLPTLTLVGAVEINALANHSCARRNNQTVFCWGENDAGQIGDGTQTTALTPTRVLNAPPAASIAVGSRFSCLIRPNGRVNCWGVNNFGQLGIGTTGAPVLEPTRVVQLNNATQVAPGANFACALRENGNVSCWGDNSFGQLGQGFTSIVPQPSPVQVVFPSP